MIMYLVVLLQLVLLAVLIRFRVHRVSLYNVPKPSNTPQNGKSPRHQFQAAPDGTKFHERI